MSSEEVRAEDVDSERTPDFEAVYDRFAAWIFNYCCYQLGDIHAAEDAASSALERIYLHLDRYDRRRGRIGAWVFSIARNAVRDAQRAKRRSRTASLCSVPELESPAPTPEEVAVLEDSKARLMRLVAHLPRRERDVVSLKFSSGLSNRSIGRMLGLRDGHVAVVLHRAIRALRRAREEEERL